MPTPVFLLVRAGVRRVVRATVKRLVRVAAVLPAPPPNHPPVRWAPPARAAAWAPPARAARWAPPARLVRWSPLEP